MNAAIDAKWVEEIAGELVQRSRSEPHWDETSEAVLAYERVTLFGLPLAERRRVQWKRFDPAHARELFIWHALVQGQWSGDYTFERHNTQLRRELRQIEDRVRQRGLVGDDDAVFDFFDERVPEGVATGRDFEAWWEREERRRPKFLHLAKSDLLRDEVCADSAEHDREFPREWHSGDQRLQLRYRFEPGSEHDGVTVDVPLPLLPRLAHTEFEQLVPGMRHELVTALIKTLPKAIRKHVVPAADWARTLLTAIEPQLSSPSSGGGSDTQRQNTGAAAPGSGAAAAGSGTAAAGSGAPAITELLAREIKRRVSAPVTADDFDIDRLPPHLRPTFRVLDHKNRVVGSGKDLAELTERHADRVNEAVAGAVAGAISGTAQRADRHADKQSVGHHSQRSAGRGAAHAPAGAASAQNKGQGTAQASGAPYAVSQSGLTVWPTEPASGEPRAEIRQRVEVTLGGGRASQQRRSSGSVRAFPALIDRKKTVDLALLATAHDQRAQHRLGVRRLLQLSSPSPASYVRDHLSNNEKLLLAAGPYRTIDDAVNDVRLAVAERVIRELAPDGLVWQHELFNEICDRYVTEQIEAIYEALELVTAVLREAKAARQAIDRAKSLTVLGQVTDAASQLDALVWAHGSGEGFVSRTGLAQLKRLPVYLQAVTHRMQQLTEDPGRDRARQSEVEAAQQEYLARGGSIPHRSSDAEALIQVRWQLEELRVSLFAQQLGAAGKVSPQRIQKRLQELPGG